MADSDGAPLPTGSYWIWPRHPKAGSWWLRPRGDDVFQATGRWPEVMGCHGSHGNGAIKSDKKRITGLFWASWACFFSIETEHDWTIQNHPFAGEADIFDPFPRDSRGGRIWANCGADAFEPYPKLYQNVNPINLSFLTWPRIETCAKKRPLSDWIEQAGPIVACRSRASHVLGRLVSPWQVSHPRTWPKFNSTSSDLKFQHVQGGKTEPKAGLLSNVACCHCVSNVRHLSTAICALFCRTTLAVSLPVIFWQRLPSHWHQVYKLVHGRVAGDVWMYEGTRVVVLVYEGTGVEAMYEGSG